MRKRPMREPEDLATFDLAFHAERSPVPACGSSHTQSCTTLLLRCLRRLLVAACTNVEPDDGRLAASLRCAIFEFGLRALPAICRRAKCRLRLAPLDCSALATVGGVAVFLQHGFRDVDGTRDRPDWVGTTGWHCWFCRWSYTSWRNLKFLFTLDSLWCVGLANDTV